MWNLNMDLNLNLNLNLNRNLNLNLNLNLNQLLALIGFLIMSVDLIQHSHLEL
jgi:hypothetical protein